MSSAPTYDEVRNIASKIDLPWKAFIAGAAQEAKSGETFATVDPATGKVLANIALCGRADVDAAVDAARRTFDAGVWSRLGAADRKAIMKRLAELIDANRLELAVLEKSRKRQACYRLLQYRRARHGAHDRVVRRGYRQALRSALAGEQYRRRTDRARADRCRRGGAAMELSLDDAGLEAWSRIGDRQQRRRQTGRADQHDGAPRRPAGAGSPAFRRGSQHRHRRWADNRPGHRPSS